ncbi:MAG: YigZ family protein [Lachnospiraceae bacterium]
MALDKKVFQGGEGEIVEKKSRFIAHIQPAETEQEAMEFVAQMKKKYYDARHNCYAYIIGRNGEAKKFSDDGEPSGTAGRPMLDVLEKEGIYNVVAVVTRYFGGTLLGTGGLVRAYQGSLQEGLKNCTLAVQSLGQIATIEIPYTLLGKVQYFCAKEEIPVLDTDYQETIRMKCMFEASKAQEYVKALQEQSDGQLCPELGEEVEYSIVDGEVHY